MLLILAALVLLISITADAQAFIGRLKTTAPLQDGPGKEYASLRSLATGARIFVFGTGAQSGYLEVIDLNSNVAGFIEKKNIKFLLPMNPAKPLKPVYASITDSENPAEADLELYNRTGSTISFKLDNLSFRVSAGASINIKIEPGSHQYYAFQMARNPKVGSTEFEAGKSYRWDFVKPANIDNRTGQPVANQPGTKPVPQTASEALLRLK